jgi:hypothetical protein
MRAPGRQTVHREGELQAEGSLREAGVAGNHEEHGRIGAHPQEALRDEVAQGGPDQLAALQGGGTTPAECEEGNRSQEGGKT